MSDEVKPTAKADRVRKAKTAALQLSLPPHDAPFYNVRDVAIIYRTTPAAIRKAMETEGDTLGIFLRSCLVQVTSHRRLFDRRRVDAEIQKSLPPTAESA